jgi:CheY-like chemotaxis protein
MPGDTVISGVQPTRPVITSLVVDDSAPVRRLLRGMLEADGYLVHEAPDGQAALGMLRRNLPRYLVLLDYSMPVLDGWEMLRAAEAEGGHLFSRHAFILMTADLAVLPPECIAFVEARRIPVIQKPISQGKLSRLAADAALRLTVS